MRVPKVDNLQEVMDIIEITYPNLLHKMKKLADEAFKQYFRSQRIHTELKQLGGTLELIQALLYDASEKEVTKKVVAVWLNSVRHLAYEVDDVLDDVSTEAMHHELTEDSGAITSKVRKLIPTCCTKFSLSYRLRHKLDSVTSKLQHLEKQKMGLGLVVINDKPNGTSIRNETSLLEPNVLQYIENHNIDIGLIEEKEKPKSSYRRVETDLPESKVVGRDDVNEKLLSKLLSSESSSKENFSIIPIVGMGGVGKTTLARLLYNNTKVQNHFESKAWVWVPDGFDIFKISEKIFQSVAIENENKEFKDLNLLQRALLEKFRGKKFLLVVDDVWTEDPELWDKLMRPFLSGAPGSKIILTTRKDKLLKNLGLNHLDRLESLSFKDSLSLLALYALGVEDFNSDPKHLELIPKAVGIVEKCGRLPLALKAVGRLLSTKKDGNDWNDVLNSRTWDAEIVSDLSDDWKAIFPALRLSYDDLSANLKLLFAYCSLFPRGFLFDKEELIQLWMAEGFLDLSNDTKYPEEFGHEYFEELLSRSFFQQVSKEKSLYVMHDLMNELATFVSGEFFLRLDNHMEMGKRSLEKYHHISFTCDEYVAYQQFEAFKRAKGLRTFLALSIKRRHSGSITFLSNKILVDLLPELQLLRVLSLSHLCIVEVPETIGNLKHLRYLNLSYTPIKDLPENVCNLYNLQTLIVFSCHSLIGLPKSFSKLQKLRHFDIRHTPLLEKLPLGIGELESLQTLGRVIVGGDSGFAISELKKLNNLHGEISIEGLHKVQSAIHVQEASLSLKRPTKLELKWGDGPRRESLDMNVLNELKPYSDKLKMLGIERYGGTKFSNWVGDPSFSQLVHVSIRGCRKCTSLPPLGHLRLLKELFIQSMDEVKVIGSKLTGTVVVSFPSLEVLGFEDMSGWKVWSSNRMTVFPCLRELHIRNCPNLIEVSVGALPSLMVLELDKCGDDEVWRGVIAYLEAVEEVSISNCNEIRYLWESEAEASKLLVKLQKLKVYRCENLRSLGEKEEVEEDNTRSNLLSSLRMLEVSFCLMMKRLHCPNSIEILEIIDCDFISHVSFPTTTKGRHKLKSLKIYGHSISMEEINTTNMPKLEVIDISGPRNLKSITQLSNSIHLTELHTQYCPGIKSFPDIQLPKLTVLRIESCENITSFAGLQLPNLTWLRIARCKGMESFPSLLMPSLTDLIIVDCQNMMSFPMLIESVRFGSPG